MAGIGQIAGALGPIALGVAALYAIVSSMDDSGTYHAGGAGSYSASGGAATGLKVLDQGLTFGVGAEHYSKEAEQAAVGISQGIVQMLDQTAKSFGRDAGYYAATAFADDSSKDGAWGSLAIKLGDKVLLDWKDTQTSRWAPREFADGAEGQKEYTAALVSGVRDVLKSTIGDVAWAQSIVDKLGDAPTLDALSGAVQQINATNAAFGVMGQTLDGFGGITDEMKSALIAASGGMDALAANAGAFYENFYTDAERLQRAVAALTEEFAKTGHAMPATEAAYRALVEEQMKAGTSGAALAAQLLTLAPAFAQVAAQQKAAVEAAGISGAKIADTLRDAMLGRMDASGAGAQIAGMVTDGIYNALSGGLAAQLSDMMMSILITPVVQAAIAGTSVSEAVSRGAIDNMIESARAAAEALEQVFSDAEFLSAIESIGDAINRLAPFIDEYLYTKARRKGEIVYVLRVPFVTGLALYGLEGDRVEVTVTDDLGNALMLPLVRGLWEQAYGLYEYLFSDLQRVEKFTLRDIPLHPRTIITVRIVRNNADVDAAVGWISVGQWQTFYAPRSTAGGTQHGVETTPKAYNYFQRDENTGKYKRRPGRRATLISGRVLIDAKQGPRAKALLDKVQGIPVAIEASPLDRYSHISTVGLLTGSVVDDNAVDASINFKVEGNV